MPSPDALSLVEVAKTSLLTIMTGGALWTARTVFIIRDDVRTISHELFGKDGNNGMRSVVKGHAENLEKINARNIAMDAVTAAEHDEYAGEERRHENRRLRDLIREELDKSVSGTSTQQRTA